MQSGSITNFIIYTDPTRKTEKQKTGIDTQLRGKQHPAATKRKSWSTCNTNKNRTALLSLLAS